MTNHDNPQEDPQEISLQELTDAFARAMGTAQDEVAPLPVETPVAVTDAAELEESDSCPISPATIFEAMLFVGNRGGQPLTPYQAAELMRGVTPGEVADLVELLNRRYANRGCPYEIVSEESGYRLTLRKTFHRLRDVFYGRVREVRLSQAAIDTLAIVAYQQPISAAAINKLRGKPTNHLLTQLVRRGLLRVERHEGGKAQSYFTTDRFLELFGLQSLGDLPQSEELDRL